MQSDQMSDVDQRPECSRDYRKRKEEDGDPKAQLHGLVIKPGSEGHVTVLCGSMPLNARLPEKKTDDELSIVPGCWVNLEMNLNVDTSEANQIIGECEHRYKTYLFDDGTFSLVCPAAYYVEDGVDEDDVSIAYTPFFKFVDDPKGILQAGDWLEWYECVLTASDDSAYLLKVDRMIRHLPGCIEPGSMPGQTPSSEQIMNALEQEQAELRNNFKGVREVLSSHLGLCIGHVVYTRVANEATGTFSSYGSGMGQGRGRGRGSSYYNDRWGGNDRGRGGYGGGYGGNRGYGGESSNDWRRDRDAFQYGNRNNNDGNWRVGARQERDAQPGMQHQRSGHNEVKQVRAPLIYSTRGVMISKLESEDFQAGSWLTFDKISKSEMAAAKEMQGKDSYPPYILQHHVLPAGHGGKTRTEGPGKWNVQVMVKTEYGCLRKQMWYDPGFFTKIACNDRWRAAATKRLAKEKHGWATMSEQERDEVILNVWVGLPDSPELINLAAMEPYPRECKWEVRDLPNAEFIHDLPLDRARLAGALSNIVL